MIIGPPESAPARLSEAPEAITSGTPSWSRSPIEGWLKSGNIVSGKAFVYLPKMLVASKPFFGLPSSSVPRGRRLSGSEKPLCTPGSDLIASGRAPLPWRRSSGVPSPSKSAATCEAAMPSATTGKSLSDVSEIGQFFRYFEGALLPRPSMIMTGPAAPPPPMSSFEPVAMSGMPSPLKSATVGVVMMRL
jgi:hypothetical protein